MEKFQSAVLPLLIAVITVFGLIKKLPVFEIFIEGGKKALSQTAGLLPTLTALCVLISMLMSSGLTEFISSLLSPVARLINIPEEVLPLSIISTFSGSGSISVLESIFESFSPDSYIGRTASVIASAGETTFYTVAVYYSAANITDIRHTIPCAITSDIITTVAAGVVCRFL